jgi:hypothetical protein
MNQEESWFRVLGSYKSMVKARSLSILSRRWLFFESWAAKPILMNEYLNTLGTRKAAKLVQTGLDLDDGYSEDEEPGTWTVDWEMVRTVDATTGA